MHTFTQVYHDDIVLWNYSRSNFMRSRLDVIVNNSTDLSTPTQLPEETLKVGTY
jgi:hypothetical protein